MRVLIAGCGYVGTALAMRLAQKGCSIVAIKRSPGKPLPGVQWLSFDLVAEQGRPDIGPVDAVVYAAAADEHSDKAYERVYVQGVRNLITVISRGVQGNQPFIFISSTGVYGQNDGSVVDESSETTPEKFNGKRLLEGEALVLGSAFRGIVLRFGGIYGPGRAKMIDRYWANGVGQGESSGYLNLIHRDDCVGIIDHFLFASPKENKFIGVDCEPVKRAELNNWLRAQLKLPGTTDVVPHSKLRNKRCSNQRLLQTGYEFRYPSFREGLAPLIKEFLQTQKVS